MAQDARYISAVSLQSYFIDKTTGESAAGGKVWFYEDLNRTTPKTVYQLTGSPPNYTYTPLSNPVILSSVGTFQDNSGNDIALYYFPYESTAADAAVQQYYVVVKDANDVPLFTRQAWPPLSAIEGGGGTNVVYEGSITNQISNPQFVDVLFIPGTTLELAYTGSGNTTTTIAPGWSLYYAYTGNGSINVSRTPVAGSQRYPTNPPYVLTITPGANLTTLKLIQRLPNNPDIWSLTTSGSGGYLAGSVVVNSGVSVTMTYEPSTGTAVEIFNLPNTSGAFKQLGATVQLPLGDNPSTGDDGYVNIVLLLSATVETQITSIQVVGLESNASAVAYQQNTVNRQNDQLFHYYNPLLQYKPIPSYLIGWDFPLNPAQFATQNNSGVLPVATGNNKSYYAWDQTIVFQTVTSGVQISRNGIGGFRATAQASPVQIAIIQYLPVTTARSFLNETHSVAIQATTDVTNGIVATCALYYTEDLNLPSTVGLNNSIVATLDANGKPATLNGTWVEIPRSNLGNAKFTIMPTTMATLPNTYSFSGWEAVLDGAANNAEFIAIVIGTAEIPAGKFVDFDTVGLVAGDIPTIPAPESAGQVLAKCQSYYRMSFSINTAPATAVGLGHGESYYVSGTSYAQSTTNTFSEQWHVPMHAMPSSITFYDPVNASNTIYDQSTGVSCNIFGSYVNQRGFYLSFDQDAGAHQSGIFILNWTVDARLGQ